MKRNIITATILILFVGSAFDIVLLPSVAAQTTYNVYFSSSGLTPVYSWSVTLNGQTESSSSPGNNVYTITFSEPNGVYSYTVTPPSGFTASPSSGPITVNGADQTVQINFNSAPPPTPLSASASAAPTSGYAPLSVRFTGSASGGSSPYSYSWSFGDGSSSNQQNPSHTYQSADGYTATLTVTDSVGSTAAKSITITVSSPAAYVVTITSSSGGSVSYSSSYGSGTVSSGQSTRLQVPSGTQISLTANPDSQQAFGGWSTSGSVYVSNGLSASTTLTVNGNGEATADFVLLMNLGVSITPTSATIQVGNSVQFTASASGGSSTYTHYVWYWMQYGTANQGSYDSASLNMYRFTPSQVGSYGVYVGVTDSSSNSAQSLSSSVTAQSTPPPSTSNLQVLVYDRQTGNPIQGATVTTTSAPSGQNLLSGTTDSSGQYTFQNIQTGSYSVEVTASGYSSGTGSAVVQTGQTDDVTILLPARAKAVYFSVEPVAVAPLTDLNSSVNGLETPPTPSPVGGSFTVEIHLRNATQTNVPAGVTGVEVHFYFGNILSYAVPTGFTNMIGQPGGVLSGSDIDYVLLGFYDANGNNISSAPYSGAVYYEVAAAMNGGWNGADGVVAKITFEIIKQPQSGQGEQTVSFPLTLVEIGPGLMDGNIVRIPHDIVQGTSTIDAARAGGSISGVVFYLDAEGNVVTIPEATVSLTSTSYSTTTDAQGRYSLTNIPFDRWMMSCNASGYPERNEYATINNTNPDATVHFCMKAQIMDDLQEKAIAALNNIDSWLQTEAQHIDNFAFLHSLQVSEDVVDAALGVAFQYANVPALAGAVIKAYFLKGLISSTATTLANILNTYHLGGSNGVYQVCYQSSLNDVRQQVEQSFRPIDSASIFKYPVSIDRETKAYLSNVSDHFESIATTYYWDSSAIDNIISLLETESYVYENVYKVGQGLTIAGGTIILVPGLGLAVGGPIAVAGYATTIGTSTAEAGEFLKGYQGVLLPLFFRDAMEAITNIANIEGSLSDAFNTAMERNQNPSFEIPSVQVIAGQNPAFTIKNTFTSGVSISVGCVVGLYFSELVGQPYDMFTYEEPAFSINSGAERGFSINYPSNVVAWVDQITSQITSPTQLTISVVVYANYGEKVNDEYAAQKQIMTWTATEYPANYNEYVMHSPCDLHIYDAQGDHIGINYTSGEAECGIPHSLYYVNETPRIMILDPSGMYTVRLVGTGNGEYHLNVRSIFATTVTSNQWVNGTIANGQTIDYHVYVNASSIPIIDNSPPTTQIFIGEPKYVYPVSNVTYVTQYTPFTLEAYDNESGVSYTAYHVYSSTYDGSWQNYTTQFVLDPLKDGNYTIEFYSVDNAGNVEATNSVNVTLHWFYGDINHDGKVNLNDLALVAKAYRSRPGDPNWNQYADLAPPWGIISLTDLVTLAIHYGQTFHP